MRKSNALMYVVAPSYVLYPQARDRCMPLAAMSTRKVRRALVPRVDSAAALSVILLSSFIIKSQVLRLESYLSRHQRILQPSAWPWSLFEAQQLS